MAKIQTPFLRRPMRFASILFLGLCVPLTAFGPDWRPTLPGSVAVIRNGLACAPVSAPACVQRAIRAVKGLSKRPDRWEGAGTARFTIKQMMARQGCVACCIPWLDFGEPTPTEGALRRESWAGSLDYGFCSARARFCQVGGAALGYGRSQGSSAGATSVSRGGFRGGFCGEVFHRFLRDSRIRFVGGLAVFPGPAYIQRVYGGSV